MSEQTPVERIIDAKERRELVPYTDMHIWRLEQKGKFPQRVKLDPKRGRLGAVRSYGVDRGKVAERDEAATHAPGGNA